MRKFDIEVEYKVRELVTVEADTVDEAEERALEMVAEVSTNRNIVGDDCDFAEIYSSMEAQND